MQIWSPSNTGGLSLSKWPTSQPSSCWLAWFIRILYTALFAAVSRRWTTIEWRREERKREREGKEKEGRKEWRKKERKKEREKERKKEWENERKKKERERSRKREQGGRDREERKERINESFHEMKISSFLSFFLSLLPSFVKGQVSRGSLEKKFESICPIGWIEFCPLLQFPPREKSQIVFNASKIFYHCESFKTFRMQSVGYFAR